LHFKSGFIDLPPGLGVAGPGLNLAPITAPSKLSGLERTMDGHVLVHFGNATHLTIIWAGETVETAAFSGLLKPQRFVELKTKLGVKPSLDLPFAVCCVTRPCLRLAVIAAPSCLGGFERSMNVRVFSYSFLIALPAVRTSENVSLCRNTRHEGQKHANCYQNCQDLEHSACHRNPP
jgi:hypothetical protein